VRNDHLTTWPIVPFPDKAVVWQKQIMKGCILIAIALCLFGCSKNGPDAVSRAADSTVHLAGFLATSTGSPVASYWKNGVYTDLTNDSIYSEVNSLYVDGSSILEDDMYISGNSGGHDSSSPIPYIIGISMRNTGKTGN
jgi:hypothetical protein